LKLAPAALNVGSQNIHAVRCETQVQEIPYPSGHPNIFVLKAEQLLRN
jgi:hypothetical protein